MNNDPAHSTTSKIEGNYMNIRLSLLTAVIVMCNVVAAGTIRNILSKEQAMTRGHKLVAEKNGDDTQPHILKEIALVGIYNCMADKRTLDETDAFSECCEIASLMNGHMGNEQDNDLYAHALEEIKLVVTTNQNQDNTLIKQ